LVEHTGTYKHRAEEVLNILHGWLTNFVDLCMYQGIVIGTGENSEFGEVFKMMQAEEVHAVPYCALVHFYVIIIYYFLTHFILVALWNRADHYIFALSFVLSSFFFRRLISAVAYSMSAILAHMVWS